MATDILPDTVKEVNSNTYTIRPNFQHKLVQNVLSFSLDPVSKLVHIYAAGKLEQN
jgi:hypothetical protein